MRSGDYRRTYRGTSADHRYHADDRFCSILSSFSLVGFVNNMTFTAGSRDHYNYRLGWALIRSMVLSNCLCLSQVRACWNNPVPPSCFVLLGLVLAQVRAES